MSPQTVFTYPFHHAKLQILLHGVTANSLYLSFSPCKATNLSTWCHRKQSLLILSPCKATNLTTWCHRKQSLLILFTVQSYKSYYMVSPQTVFTYPFHRAKLQILLHGVTANSLYFILSPCKATNLTTWCHRKQSLLYPFTMQSYKSYFLKAKKKKVSGFWSACVIRDLRVGIFICYETMPTLLLLFFNIGILGQPHIATDLVSHPSLSGRFGLLREGTGALGDQPLGGSYCRDPRHRFLPRRHDRGGGGQIGKLEEEHHLQPNEE